MSALRQHMIYANATRYQTFISMEIVRPDTILPQFTRVYSEEQGQQLINDLNRDYIIEKLSGWLKQRERGLEKTNQVSRSVKAAEFKCLFNERRLASLPVVIRMVAAKADELESLAPSPTANHYKYFTDTIFPIIRACRAAFV